MNYFDAGITRGAGLVTLPARMHDVHALTRVGEPSIIARIFWMFGFQRRFVRTWEWEMLLPKDGFFPQSSQTAAITNLLLKARVGDARTHVPAVEPLKG